MGLSAIPETESRSSATSIGAIDGDVPTNTTTSITLIASVAGHEWQLF